MAESDPFDGSGCGSRHFDGGGSGYIIYHYICTATNKKNRTHVNNLIIYSLNVPH